MNHLHEIQVAYSEEIEPINNHHGLDQVTPHIQMDTIVLGALNTHIPCTQVIDTSSRDLNTNSLLINHQSLVPLGKNPLVWLFLSGSIRSDEETMPINQVDRFEYCIQPIHCLLQI